jgi:hypothetical protein
MVVYIMYTSFITYNLELFCDAKMFMLLVSCHIDKHKLDGKKTQCQTHTCVFSFQGGF